MQENILVVDDNDDIRSNVAEYLRAKGWKAEEASTGPMAVAQVHTRVLLISCCLTSGSPGWMALKCVGNSEAKVILFLS